MTEDQDGALLRASDADRDRVSRLLGEALADGRLTTVEYNERLGRLYSGKTHADLDVLTRDLGAAQDAIDPSPSMMAVPEEKVGPQLAVLGETTARPTGRVRGLLVAVGLLGNVHVDLSHATIGREGVVITAQAWAGAVNVTVPADARVKMTGLPLLGSLSPTREPGPKGGPHIAVRAFAGLGSVTIHRAEDTAD